MAVVIGALRVELAANIAKFEADLGKAAKRIGRLQRSFDKFGDRATAAGQALSVDLTAPLVAVGALGAKSFLSFERGMNRVAGVSGATEAEMATLTQIAKDLGATTSFSAAQAAEGLGFLAQAGFDAAEAGAALPGVLQLAAAGGIELAEAADIATNVLSGYGMEVDQLARVNDVLAKASSSANTDVLQLGQAFKFAGPVAASAGVSFETSAAAMALMGNAGIQAEMAGTALRGAITKLVNPSKEAAGTMAELGISATDSTGRLLPLDQIIEQLGPHADNTGAIMQIFGQRAGPAMSALVSQGAAALREMTVALEESGGTAEEIAEKKLAGLTGAWTRLQSALEGVLIEIGDRLAPVLERIAGVLTDKVLPAVRGALEAFDRLSPAAKQNRLIWLGVAAAIGPALIAFGGIARALSPLLPAFMRVWMSAGKMANALFQPVVTARKLSVGAGTLRASLTGLSMSARLSAAGVALASKALLGLKFAVRSVITALGPLALGFAAFEFASWAAGALDLGGKLKWLLGITDDAADSARDADAAYEGFNQTLRQTALAAETRALEDLSRQHEALTEQLETATNSRNRRAIPSIQKQIRELERQIVAQEGAVEVAQAAVKAEQAAARASEEYTAALAAAREEAVGITDATGEQIKAARELGVSLKELSKKFGVSEKALEVYLDELDAADKPVGDLAGGLGDAGDEVEILTDKVNSLVGRLRGTGAIQSARDWAAAVGQVGGLTRLTAGETDELARVLDTALEKYRLLGERAPISLLQLHEQTVAVRSQMAALNGVIGNTIKGTQPVLASTSLAGVLTVPLQVAPNIDPGVFASFGERFEGFGTHLSQTFAQAFEGGGGIAGALGSLGTQVLGGMGDIATKAFGESSRIGQLLSAGLFSAIPGIGPFLSAFGPVLIAGLGKIGKKIGGFFKRLFGGPSERELAGRQAVQDFEKGIIAGLNATQRAEAGGERWKQVVIGVRDAYLAVGKTAKEGERAVGRMWDAQKRGPEAVAAVQREIQAVLRLAADLNERSLSGIEDVREAVIQAGGSAAEAEALWNRWVAAVKQGPEAVAAVTSEMDAWLEKAAEVTAEEERLAATAAAEAERIAAERAAEEEARAQEIERRNLEIARGLEGIRDAGQDAFSPEQLEPYLAQLQEAGLLTAEQAAELRRLADEAHVDWRAMEEAARQYGVGIKTVIDEAGNEVEVFDESLLGLGHAQAKLSDEAGQLADAWTLLTGEGASTQAAIEGMTDEAQAFVTKALEMGLGFPAAMQPMLEAMVAQGLLTDENGEKLIDLSRLSFADPIVEGFDKLADSIEMLIIALGGPSGLTKAVEEMVAAAGLDIKHLAGEWTAMTEDAKAEYGDFALFVEDRALRDIARAAALNFEDLADEWAAMTEEQKAEFGDFASFLRDQELRKMVDDAGLKFDEIEQAWRDMTEEQRSEIGSFREFVNAELDKIKDRTVTVTTRHVTVTEAPPSGGDGGAETVPAPSETPSVPSETFLPRVPRDAVFAQHGTPFAQHGRGRRFVLHGIERVMTAMEGRGIQAALGNIRASLAGIADLSGVRALASGGLVTRPTLAMLGERGREAVIPLERMEAFTGGDGATGGDRRPVVINVRLPDDTLLVEYFVRRTPEVLEALGRA